MNAETMNAETMNAETMNNTENIKTETMNAETMNNTENIKTETISSENTDINISVTTIYINTLLCIFGCVLGIVRLSLGLLSSSFIMIGYGLSLCSISVEKSMTYVSEDINVLYVNNIIQTITEIVNITLSKTEYDSHLFNNQTISEVKDEYDGDDEYDNLISHIRDDESDSDDDEEDDEEDDEVDDEENDEVTKINNIFESLDTTDDVQTINEDDADYADLPDLIPFNYNEDDDDDYADLPDLVPCNYIDDDITDVTEQYLAEREANKVVVDLTSDTNETH